VSAARPLQNRIDPFGDFHATPERLELMGNRGGRLHRDDQTLTSRRWVNRAWIACLTAFKGRKRSVWGASYTELFFLDEPSAFAAGHRPCFECRRADALRFRDALGGGLSAGEMDLRLHAERLDGRRQRRHRLKLETLPDGAFVAIGDRALAVRGPSLLPWSFGGYGAPVARPRGEVDVLTPPTILVALAAGYPARFAGDIQAPTGTAP
jgi:hypothetical protein